MEVKWIKITTDIFDDEKVQIIETLPEADSIIVIWFKLLVLAGKSNNNGVFMINNKIPYTDEMLAAIFHRNVNIIRLAIKTFEEFNMISIIDNVITLPNWEKHQNNEGLDKIREQTRQRVALYREKQAKIAQSNAIVTLRNATDKEEEKDKEEDNNKSSTSVPEAARRLSELLYSLHQKKDAGYKVSEAALSQWSKDIDKINRIDGRSWDNIEKVIRWCKQEDNFWFPNIMSGKKLREKFPTLLSQMERKPGYSQKKEEKGVERKVLEPPVPIKVDDLPAWMI